MDKQPPKVVQGQRYRSQQDGTSARVVLVKELEGVRWCWIESWWTKGSHFCIREDTLLNENLYECF